MKKILFIFILFIAFLFGFSYEILVKDLFTEEEQPIILIGEPIIEEMIEPQCLAVQAAITLQTIPIKEEIEEEMEALTDEEWKCLYRVARAEAGARSKEGQKNVVYVVLNRMYSDKFKEDTIQEVVHAKGQFSVVSNGSYYKVEISDFTKENVKEAYYDYIEGESAEGALFFKSGKKTNTFNKAAWIFTDEVGHHFYK